jgi:DNA-binding HxlR family transcriptional regulator
VSDQADTTTPRPGTPVRGSRTGRPLNALFDLLGRRWTMTVVWALHERALTFRELQAAAGGVAASVLNTRIRELRDARLVDSGDDGYVLTELGRGLIEAGAPLTAWADHWAAALEQDPSHDDPSVAPG